MLQVEKVEIKYIDQFRQMVEAYWQELMPKASVIKDADKREAYFQEQFAWDGGNNHPYWAIIENRPIGFVTFELSGDHKQAVVNNFYIIPEERHQGYGTTIVRWLFTYLDSHGVEQIDLNVRRDNPSALAFWQAQGFSIAGYRLRQYRDPKSGTAFVGALSSDM